MRALDAVFDRTAAHVVEFDNALTGGISSNTVYVGVASQRRRARSDRNGSRAQS